MSSGAARDESLTSSACLHLVCGSTGAGKTTYSMALAGRIAGARFSIDEWMATLFWMDRSDPVDPAWAMTRVRRCCEQIWSVTEPLLRLEVPVILDLGFSTRADRQDFAARAACIVAPVGLHFLDVDAEERWRRVGRRNEGQGPERQLDFKVTRAMFDYVEALWEAPTEAEMLVLDGVRIAG